MTHTTPIGINIEAWDEWCEYRKATRKAVSSFAAKKQFKLLLRYTEEDQQAIIDHSIANDYQGLFELKISNNKPAQTNTMDLLMDRSWADHFTEDNNRIN